MKTILKQLTFVLLVVLLFSGCSATDSTIKTYINPALNASKITSVAIFPLRNSFVQANVSLGTGDMIEINKMFQSEFSDKNTKTNIINSVSATELLNQGSLVDDYSKLLTVYTQTGIPNTETLNKIGKYLKADAIIQGFVVEVSQRDGNGAVIGNQIVGEARVTVRYVMFSTITGAVLWEATAMGYKLNPTTSGQAPITDVIEMIREKIISALPILSVE